MDPATVAAIGLGLVSLTGVGWQVWNTHGMNRAKEAVDWTEVAEKAERRAERWREMLDILRLWQEAATPLLVKCADHNPELAPAIYELLGLNQRAAAKVEEVRREETAP